MENLEEILKKYFTTYNGSFSSIKICKNVYINESIYNQYWNLSTHTLWNGLDTDFQTEEEFKSIIIKLNIYIDIQILKEKCLKLILKGV
jgi:hypothetical protein